MRNSLFYHDYRSAQKISRYSRFVHHVAAGGGGISCLCIFSSGAVDCAGSGETVANPLKSSQVDLPAARKLYLDKCAECHGEAGKGDGPQGKMYDPLPKDLTDASHMNALSDGELFYKISEGHRPMPAFRKRLTEEQRWQLVLFLRSLTAAPSPALASPLAKLATTRNSLNLIAARTANGKNDPSTTQPSHFAE